MKKQTLVRDATVMLLALFAAYAMVMLTQAVMGRIEGVAMLIFMLAVFVTSMYTEGYAWGVAASLISVLAVNFAFLSPYFAFNFTLSENLFSGLVMLVVSIMTSTLTTRIKKQEQLRMESEKEKMRANLLRAVSHDLRTPLTSIYGACSTVIENYDSLDKEKTIKLLGEACSDAQWLTRMVENLLSVTRIDSEKVTVQKTPTVLDELLDTVLVMMDTTSITRPENSVFSRSLGMPQPSSVTSNTARLPTVNTFKVSFVMPSACRAAFSSRFISTCWMSMESMGITIKASGVSSSTGISG